MRRRPSALLLAFCVIPACAPSDAPRAIDTADPNTLEWVTPRVAGDPGGGDATVVRVGEAFDLGVATQATDAAVVHFAIDGTEVGACDATTTCRRGDERLWTVTATTAGAHALDAWFARADGSTLHARRTLTVQSATGVAEVPASGSATEADPVGDTNLVIDGTSDFDDAPASTPALDDDIDPTVVANNPAAAPGPAGRPDTDVPPDADDPTTTVGYRDPSRASHSVFGGLAWSVQGQRVTFAHASLDADAVDVGECVRRYGTSIDRYADQYDVSRAAIVGAAMAATGCDVDAPSAAHDGLLGLRGAACAALTATDPQPLTDAACAARMVSTPDFAIEMATRWLASPSLRRLHANDPPLMAAAYATGAIAPSVANRWHLFAPADATGRRDFVTAFVAAYNTYRTQEHVGVMTRANLPGDGAPLMPALDDPFADTVPASQLSADAALQISDDQLSNDAIGALEASTVDEATHANNALAYHGGPVLNHQIPVYIIWWGARWRVNTQRADTIRRFVSHIGSSPWWLTNAAYSDGSHQNVTRSLYLAGEIHLDMVPSHGDWIRIPQTYPADVVYHAIVDGSVPLDPHAIYLVLTDDRTRMPGFGSQFCGWHEYFSFIDPTRNILVNWVGDGSVSRSACGNHRTHYLGLFGHTYPGPHNDPVDATMSVIGHELAESATDPLLNAWYRGTTSGEIGDRCAWNYGSTSSVNGGHRANLTMAGENYLIQQLWLNTAPDNHHCVMHP